MQGPDSRTQRMIAALHQDRRNPWRVYELAKARAESGAWERMTPGQAQDDLWQLAAGIDPETFAAGWQEFADMYYRFGAYAATSGRPQGHGVD